MHSNTVTFIVTTVFSLYEKWGEADYIGENVTQLEHMTQAAMAAEREQASEEMILGALFHDIGHLVALDQPGITTDLGDGLGAVNHEDIGADYLRSMGFPELVCVGSRLHVKAKRFLLTANDVYRSKVSPASLETFELQGGKMSDEELEEFRNNWYFQEAIQYRNWDDAAKKNNVELRPLEHYREMASRVLERHLSESFTLRDQQKFHKDGYLHIRHFLNSRERTELLQATRALEVLPDVLEKWMRYYEKDNSTQLARIENFLDYTPTLRRLLNNARVLYILERLFDAEPVLFKEKINFKYPGGGAFSPHQDEPAFAMFPHGFHITTCIAVDPMTQENGCLEIVPESHRQEIPQNEDKTITAEWEHSHSWKHVPMDTGDLLLFGSYLAHKSAPNTSQCPRRAYYLTYNDASKGDHRSEYYQRKRASLPPNFERESGKEYPYDPAFNVGNPIARG